MKTYEIIQFVLVAHRKAEQLLSHVVLRRTFFLSYPLTISINRCLNILRRKLMIRLLEM